ncbi:MAG: sulfatase [Planctomycetes bacterium]|nr:sulfatase [Planctomycetota bacterium]
MSPEPGPLEATSPLLDASPAPRLDEPSVACDAEAGSPVTLGDRLIVAFGVTFGVALARALLQAVVDATADEESGRLLAEHFVEHVVEATGTAWWMVLPLAILPRGKSLRFAALRGLLVAVASFATLVGWPDGEPRYTPGVDSARGYQGWAAIGLASLLLAGLDRYSLSPQRALFRLQPATRFLASATVLLLGGGALGTVVAVLDTRRRNMDLETIVVDLLDELPAARVVAAADGRAPAVGSLLAARGERVEGGNQPSLLLPVGSSVEFTLDLPRQATLRFSLGFDRSSLVADDPPPQHLTFGVAIDGVEVQSTSLRPQERAADRSWIDASIELTGATERRAVVALSLQGEGARLADVRAGFGRPRVVRREWRPRVASSRERMNVVLIVADALRADHLGCYGYGKPTSPAIDALAAEGILFEQARAPATWSWPAIATLLTGLPPPAHGVDDLDRCFLSDSLRTLPEHLAASGCTALGATANPLIRRSKNFDQGFEDWREFPLQEGSRLAEQFADWVRRFGEWQFFAFLHFHDPARPYNPPQEIAERFVPAEDVTAMRRAVNDLRLLRSARADPSRARAPVAAEEDVLPKLPESSWVGLYDGDVRSFDEQVARVVSQLRKRGLLDRTVIVVVGAYGEALHAGPAAPAGSSLARELRHVPLLIRDPRRPAARVGEIVDVSLLAATLATLAGAPPSGAAAPLALPPWSDRAARFAFFHTARALLPGAAGVDEWIGIEGDGERLVATVDGRILEFESTRPRGEAEARQKALLARLLRWHELALAEAVARPFERLDFATRAALEELDEIDPER